MFNPYALLTIGFIAVVLGMFGTFTCMVLECSDVVDISVAEGLLPLAIGSGLAVVLFFTAGIIHLHKNS